MDEIRTYFLRIRMTLSGQPQSGLLRSWWLMLEAIVSREQELRLQAIITRSNSNSRIRHNQDHIFQHLQVTHLAHPYIEGLVPVWTGMQISRWISCLATPVIFLQVRVAILTCISHLALAPQGRRCRPWRMLCWVSRESEASEAYPNYRRIYQQEHRRHHKS